MKVRLLLTACLMFMACAFIVKTTEQREARASDASRSASADEKWEYLVVSAPSSANLSPSSNSSMRKDSTGAFGREAFVLEQHLDKLGANGWELVTVGGSASDPTYFFKRRK